MPNDEPIDEFLMIAKEMFRGFFPQEKAENVFRMKRNEHALLVDREAKSVDEALTSMALAKDEQAVRAIFNELTDDTIMALCSRWMHCYRRWMTESSAVAQQVVRPASSRGLWKYVFLALISDPAAHGELLIRLDLEGRIN